MTRGKDIVNLVECGTWSTMTRGKDIVNLVEYGTLEHYDKR